ncbi:MAG: Lrp/AsnC family transcriptional regulator [Candidatus Muiribacteriota bacterium]
MDKIDCKILNILQENCRTSTKDIAEKIGLSSDSTKKRINKLLRNELFYPRIQLRLRHMGFNNIVEVRIKLHNYTQKDMDEFIEFLKENPFVSEIFSLSGEWDFSIVIVSRNPKHMIEISNNIRETYGRIIRDWAETMTTRVYKFEEFDALKLMGYD